MEFIHRARVDYPGGRSVVYRAGKIYDIITEYARPLVEKNLAIIVEPPTGRSLQDAEDETLASAAGPARPAHSAGSAFRKPRQNRRRPEAFDGSPDEGSPRAA